MMSTIDSLSSEKQLVASEKPVLFCPNCDHQDHYTGDWLSTRKGAKLSISCPNCSTVLTDRFLSRAFKEFVR
jgi:Zn-finger protein